MRFLVIVSVVFLMGCAFKCEVSTSVGNAPKIYVTCVPKDTKSNPTIYNIEE